MRHHRRPLTQSRVSLALAIATITLLGLAGCATLGIGGDTADEWGDGDVFHRWDHDNDGFIDKEDFLTNVDWFDDYDEDDDGRLDRQEFRDGPSDELEDVGNFSSYDEDGDGELTESEFNDALFEDLDDDGDGKLNSAEWGI